MESDPTLERQFKGHRDTVTSLSFHPSTNQLSSSSLDHSIMLWNFQSTLRCYRFQGHRDAVLDTRFSPSGKLIASASRDCSVRLWVPTVRGECGEFRAHSKSVRSVDFSPTGTKLITASDDKTLKLWTVHRRKFLQSYVQHKNWVRCARFSPDGTMIASCSDDKTVKLWDAENAHCIHTFEELKGYGTHVTWHPSGSYVAVGLSNGTVKLYDVRKHCLLQHYRAHEGGISQLCFHPCGNFLIVASQDKKMKILDLLEGQPIYTLMGHNGPITAVTFSNDGEYFASGGSDKQIMIWKTNFAHTENFEDSKENISTLDSSIDTGEQNKVDATKLVDARKSAFFRPDSDNDDEECCNVKDGCKSNSGMVYKHGHFSSTPNPSKSKFSSGSNSQRNQYYSNLFRRYYNDQFKEIHVPRDPPEIFPPIPGSGNTYFRFCDSKDMLNQPEFPMVPDLEMEQPALKKQRIDSCFCETVYTQDNFSCRDSPDDSTIVPTVKAMICNLLSIQSILQTLDQRVTNLESLHFI